MKKYLVFAMFVASMFRGSAQSLEERFLHPPQEAKPLVIWQWMNGYVNRDAITNDLEAFQRVGIGGVQNFQIGGEIQTHLPETSVRIGSEEWQEMMRFAIAECARLGLSFGTHNCPGWSSSGYPTVKPEDSMQKLVWSETHVTVTHAKRLLRIALPRPQADSVYHYYRDITVLAIPSDTGSVAKKDIVELGKQMDSQGMLSCRLPKGEYTLLRFGHTTNNQTNFATAPQSGTGLECDKMSREAVRKFWAGYPSLLLRMAGEYAGTTFTRMEIDSYEAGEQNWTPLMLQEFQQRRGYSLTPWLVTFTGRVVESEDATKRFKREFNAVVSDLFAECYYGEMSRLAHQTAGLKLLAQPYGRPLNSEKCVAQLKDDLLCAEFWTHPSNWGGGSVGKMSALAQKYHFPLLYGEGFTCWPLHPWQNDPATLKTVADNAFCGGVNAVMLHAAALNPWKDVKPGMAFGKWGTQFQPNQTWWENGGKQFFAYIARCQSLLQVGEVVKMKNEELRMKNTDGGGFTTLKAIHRRTSDADIYFFVNPSDEEVNGEIRLAVSGKQPQFFNPLRSVVEEASDWRNTADSTFINLSLPAHGSVFVVLQKPCGTGLVKTSRTIQQLTDSLVLAEGWTIRFPHSKQQMPTRLQSWTEADDAATRYFSGTAVYEIQMTLPRKMVKKSSRILLDLGEVKNVAEVYVNGETVGDTLWSAPFVCDVSTRLHPGKNSIKVHVTNLWVNRMVGDELLPDDAHWSDPYSYTYAPGSPVVGAFLEEEPEWLRMGTPRPTSRQTFSDFKFFRADSPLLPSGLLSAPMIRLYSDRGKNF